MLKFNRIVCALIVCVCIGVVYGRAVKIFSFIATDAGVIDSPDVDGMAIFNAHTLEKADGSREEFTNVQVSFTDLRGNTDYILVVDPGFLGTPVTTNPAGNVQIQGIINSDVFSNGNIVCVSILRDINDNGILTEIASGCTGG